MKTIVSMLALALLAEHFGIGAAAAGLVLAALVLLAGDMLADLQPAADAEGGIGGEGVMRGFSIETLALMAAATVSQRQVKRTWTSANPHPSKKPTPEQLAAREREEWNKEVEARKASKKARKA